MQAGDYIEPPLLTLCVRAIALGLPDPCLDSELEDPVHKGSEVVADDRSKVGLEDGRSRQCPYTQLPGNCELHP